LEGLRKTIKHFIQDSWIMVQAMNLRAPKHEADELNSSQHPATTIRCDGLAERELLLVYLWALTIATIYHHQ
jgi:hypothetical protein